MGAKQLEFGEDARRGVLTQTNPVMTATART